MKHLRVLLTLCVAAAGIACAGMVALGNPQAGAEQGGPASDEQARKDANKWMESKLHSSQEIFAALTRGDLKAVEVSARRMLLINILEQWKANRPYMDRTDYDAQLNAFEYATKELARTGRNNDVNGALDAYGLLAKSCVKCHQTIRDAAKPR